MQNDKLIKLKLGLASHLCHPARKKIVPVHRPRARTDCSYKNII